MNNRYASNPYLRLTAIIYLLQEIETGISVREIADYLQVPETIILEDLYNLSQSEDLDIQIEKADIDESDAFELLHDENESIFFNQLFAGEIMDIPISLYSSNFLADIDEISVQLTAYEYMILCSFLEHCHYKILEDKKDFKVKKIYNNITAENIYVMNLLQDAITNEKKVSISYLTKSKELINISLIPIKVVKTVSQDLFYLVAASEIEKEIKIGYYRFDRILNVSISKESIKQNQIKQESLLHEFEYRWGLGSYEEPFRFSIKVYNEANLPERLQTELANRKYGEWKEDVDGSFIYQDKVIDYDALKNWVLSLGSSVKVLKPKRLAEDIKASAKKRMELYEIEHCELINIDSKNIPSSEL